jgi:hypothetical protein
VITGFNTDIQYEGVTYHVQTEDKGLETPLILSLVYVGGAIIASKRTPYEDLVARGFDEKALTERLNRQHKLICAAIRAGRVADLRRMGGPAQTEKPADAEGRPISERAKAQRKKKSDATQAASTTQTASEAAHALRQNRTGATDAARAVSKNGAGTAGEPRTTEEASAASEARVIETAVEASVPHEAAASHEAAAPVEADVPFKVADVGATREDVAEEIKPAGEAGKSSGDKAAKSSGDEAAKSSGDEAGKSSGDEIIILTTLVDEIAALGEVTSYQPPTFKSEPLEPLPLHEEIPVAPKPVAPPPQPLEQPATLPHDSANELYLTLLDDEGDFRAGQLVLIKVHVGRGAYGQRAVAGAQVTVKVLGTTFRPLILTSATDGMGIAVVRALLPRFTSGRAAIIIRAVDGEDAAEMRRIIHQA